MGADELLPPGARQNSLPVQPGPLIGRVGDVSTATCRLLREDVRLLTLAGPAGVGKTRLGLAVAGVAASRFPDGVWFIELAPLADAGLVVPAIAYALGVGQVAERSAGDVVRDHLRGQRALLLLDNCEHVLAAVPSIAALLAACPDVKVLATSRTALRSRWEHVYVVPPLQTPDVTSSLAPGDLTATPATALFVQRAQAAAPAFAPDERNAAAVAELCVRLEGLPLAIELAAARCAVLPPAEILARLPRRLDLLTGGSSDSPARHRTLRAAIAWSDNLLAPPEQDLFRRLAAFTGGFSLEAAEAVCEVGSPPTSEIDVLDGLASLVAASLVNRDAASSGQPPRYRMLETIREYALERLAQSDEAGNVRRRHAGYYLALAERAALALEGPRQVAWLDRLETEHDNLRAALRLSLEMGEADRGLRLAGALGWFWWLHGHLSEGRAWLQAMLALPAAEQPTPARAGALDAAGILAYQQSDWPAALALHGESLALREALGDWRGLRHSLHGLGDARMRCGDFDAAWVHFERGLAIARAAGDAWGEALFLFHLGLLATRRGEPLAARTPGRQALNLARTLGNPWCLAYAAMTLGLSLVAAAPDGGDRAAQALLLEAQDLLREALLQQQRLGDTYGVGNSLQYLAAVASAQGRPERALRLSGAGQRLHKVAGYRHTPAHRQEDEQRLRRARQVLSEALQAAAWAEGLAMSRDEAVAYALAADELPERQPIAAARPIADLTTREWEVAALIAQGLTNRQIGDALVISEGTARVHVAHVLAKLGFHSRVQVAAWAAEQGRRGPAAQAEIASGA